MIIKGWGSGQTNALLNLIGQQDDIDKIYLYGKNLSEPKYEFFIKNAENYGIKHFIDLKTFKECSNNIDVVYDDIDNYNLTRERKFLIGFDNMIADIMKKKKKLKPQLKSLDAENKIFPLYLSRSLIFPFQKMSHYIQHII